MIENYLHLLQLFLLVLLLVFLSSIGSRISSNNINHLNIDLKGLLCDLQFIVVKPNGNNNNKKDRSVVGDGITDSTQELVFLKIALFLKNNDILLMTLYKFYLLL